MKQSTLHLQTETPVMEWEDWYVELCNHFAKALQIDPIAACRHCNASEARSWYDDGFTPYVTFRENFKA